MYNDGALLELLPNPRTLRRSSTSICMEQNIPMNSYSWYESHQTRMADAGPD